MGVTQWLLQRQEHGARLKLDNAIYGIPRNYNMEHGCPSDLGDMKAHQTFLLGEVASIGHRLTPVRRTNRNTMI